MLKNMKIGKRLLATFLIVSFITSLAGVIGMLLLKQTDETYSEALVVNGFVQGDIGNFNTYVSDTGALIRDIIMTSDPAAHSALQAKRTELAAKVNDAYAKLAPVCLTEQELPLVKKMDEAWKACQPLFDEVQNLSEQNDIKGAFTLFNTKALPYLNECTLAGRELMQLNSQMGDAIAGELSGSAFEGLVTMLTIMIVALAVSVTMSIVAARSVSRPIAQIQDAAKQIARGDYDVVIEYTARDEMGELAESMRTMVSTTRSILHDAVRGLGEIADKNFNTMPSVEFIGIFKGIEDAMGKLVSDLSNTMADIMVSSDQVASGSRQVSIGAQTLAQGATEQASSVETLSISINSTLEKITSNAKNAEEVNDLAVIVGGKITTSNAQMEQMKAAMEQISESSSQIGNIIKTIEDIAFQTNILALNAAVEAARAGTAGKGFAVVADEVRNLATKSTEAAKQTNALIESSNASVRGGVAIANTTASSLAEVVEGANKVVELVAQISQATIEQEQSVSQIKMGVEQIAAVVQTNSATSEESAAASEELNGQADLMKEEIAKFRLNKDVIAARGYGDSATEYNEYR